MNKTQLLDIIGSWQNLELLLKHLMAYPEDLALLADVAFDDSKYEFWRAAWVMDQINTQKPELIKPYLPAIFKALKKTENQSKLRHFLRMITYHDIPAAQRGPLFDFCLNAFDNQTMPVAVRAHALQIIYNISLKEPGLKDELIQILEYELSQEQTPGIKARGKNILSLLYGESRNKSNQIRSEG